MQNQNLHIRKLNKNYVWASIRYQGRYSMMSCCLDTNHFVGTPPYLESYCVISHYGGRVNYSSQFCFTNY